MACPQQKKEECTEGISVSSSIPLFLEAKGDRGLIYDFGSAVEEGHLYRGETHVTRRWPVEELDFCAHKLYKEKMKIRLNRVAKKKESDIQMSHRIPEAISLQLTMENTGEVGNKFLQRCWCSVKERCKMQEGTSYFRGNAQEGINDAASGFVAYRENEDGSADLMFIDDWYNFSRTTSRMLEKTTEADLKVAERKMKEKSMIRAREFRRFQLKQQSEPSTSLGEGPNVVGAVDAEEVDSDKEESAITSYDLTSKESKKLDSALRRELDLESDDDGEKVDDESEEESGELKGTVVKEQEERGREDETEEGEKEDLFEFDDDDEIASEPEDPVDKEETKKYEEDLFTEILKRERDGKKLMSDDEGDSDEELEDEISRTLKSVIAKSMLEEEVDGSMEVDGEGEGEGEAANVEGEAPNEEGAADRDRKRKRPVCFIVAMFYFCLPLRFELSLTLPLT